ncbi:flagellar protein FliS [Microbacterium sp. NRRL B-14842]|uniref:flagellar export chaperone FliS n=1 Tax=Microbacterium sp. NRRL B-14842 TaxID=3162881 RepID=UPI003D271001
MLYDRLLLDIERAETAQRAADWAEANTQLQHAQAIVAELSSSLTDGWSGSAGLRSLYVFLSQTLIGANIGRDPERTMPAASSSCRCATPGTPPPWPSRRAAHDGRGLGPRCWTGSRRTPTGSSPRRPDPSRCMTSSPGRRRPRRSRRTSPTAPAR